MRSRTRDVKVVNDDGCDEGGGDEERREHRNQIREVRESNEAQRRRAQAGHTNWFLPKPVNSQLEIGVIDDGSGDGIRLMSARSRTFDSPQETLFEPSHATASRIRAVLERSACSKLCVRGQPRMMLSNVLQCYVSGDMRRTVEVEAVVRRVDGSGELVIRGRFGTRWVVQRLAIWIDSIWERFCVLVAFQGRFIRHGDDEVPRREDKRCGFNTNNDSDSLYTSVDTRLRPLGRPNDARTRRVCVSIVPESTRVAYRNHSSEYFK